MRLMDKKKIDDYDKIISYICKVKTAGGRNGNK